MKTARLAILAALLAVGLTATVQAQVESAPTLQQPASAKQVTFEYGEYLSFNPVSVDQADQSPSDRMPSARMTAAADVATGDAGPAACAGSCDRCGGCGSCGCGCHQPWKLPQLCTLQRAGITMGGWLQQGVSFNADKPADKFNGPVMTNDRDREYQLNQLWLYFVRPTKTDGCGWDLGGRIDVAYGEDWRFGQNFGLENRFDSPNQFYGLILPQFYMEVAVNDLTVKMGHFATFTSYEVVPAPLNFFYSHTYLMGGYFDPLLVTGLQAEYKLNDNWTAVGGFNRGWMMFEDPSNSLNFLGGAKWASDDKRSTLSVMVDAGPQQGFTGTLNDRTSCYLVFTRQLTERLLFATQNTTGFENNGSVVRANDDAEWFGIASWLIYKLSPKWSAGLRYEWVRDEDGARIAGVGNVLLTDRGWDGLPGFAGSFNDLSLGLNYRPHPNFVFRPELRWDWYDGPRNGGGELPFNTGTKSQQFLAAMDLIVTF